MGHVHVHGWHDASSHIGGGGPTHTHTHTHSMMCRRRSSRVEWNSWFLDWLFLIVRVVEGLFFGGRTTHYPDGLHSHIAKI
jgi:hypothetical protein